MRFSLLLVLGALFAGGAGARAQTDDAREALLQTHKALHDVPAYRVTTTSVDLDTNKVTLAVVEAAGPDALRMHMEEDGQVKMEMVTDGKKAFIRRGVGEAFQAAPSGVAVLIANARKSSSLETLQTAENVKMVGHDNINGTPASVYTFDTEVMGVHSASKLWVSDKDHLPLKRDADSHGELKLGPGVGRKTNRRATSTFGYDPAIKVTLPEG